MKICLFPVMFCVDSLAVNSQFHCLGMFVAGVCYDHIGESCDCHVTWFSNGHVIR